MLILAVILHLGPSEMVVEDDDADDVTMDDDQSVKDKTDEVGLLSILNDFLSSCTIQSIKLIIARS